MKRVILNDATTFKDDMVEGFIVAYGRYVRRVPDASGVMAVGAPLEGKVSVVVGGGSGHYPAFCGVVGQGFADGAVIGDIFTSPSGEQAYRCARALDGGAGVLFSYGNYSGDVMNFDMAQMRCRSEGMDVRTVIVTDDVASAPKGREEERRGVAGDFYVFKAAGASAARGDDINGVEEAARRANARTRSIGIAFAGCTVPGQTEPLFTVEPGTMEVGMGVHGEPGIQTAELLPASGIAELLVDTVLGDAPDGAGSRAAVMLNGLGSTKYEELFVLYRDVRRALDVLREAEEELGRLDAAAGDGDHGAGMVRGMAAAVEAARGGGGSAGSVLLRSGMAFSDAAGGASGALYGACITALGQSLGNEEPDAATLREALKASLSTLGELGGAKPGDKTMIDTLDPFVRSFGEAVESGAALADAWQQALSAAEEGADSTADMVSEKGRAAKLGERSRGHKDPGAISMLYVLRAAGEALG